MDFTKIYNPSAEIGKMDQDRPTLVKKEPPLAPTAPLSVATLSAATHSLARARLSQKTYPIMPSWSVTRPDKSVGCVCVGKNLPQN
ncbi:MAG: hypothetical protein JW925_13865 [Syntrophaceae bacterium]|nr:hypothetical protein [Syntrophaceae bacterium]